MAEGYGGFGLKLSRGDDVTEKLQKALEVSRDEQKPVLLNVLIGKTTFRDGSISV